MPRRMKRGKKKEEMGGHSKGEKRREALKFSSDFSNRISQNRLKNWKDVISNVSVYVPLEGEAKIGQCIG